MIASSIVSFVDGNIRDRCSGADDEKSERKNWCERDRIATTADGRRRTRRRRARVLSGRNGDAKRSRSPDGSEQQRRRRRATEEEGEERRQRRKRERKPIVCCCCCSLAGALDRRAGRLSSPLISRHRNARRRAAFDDQLICSSGAHACMSRSDQDARLKFASSSTCRLFRSRSY